MNRKRPSRQQQRARPDCEQDTAAHSIGSRQSALPFADRSNARQQAERADATENLARAAFCARKERGGCMASECLSVRLIKLRNARDKDGEPNRSGFDLRASVEHTKPGREAETAICLFSPTSRSSPAVSVFHGRTPLHICLHRKEVACKEPMRTDACWLSACSLSVGGYCVRAPLGSCSNSAARTPQRGWKP